jgi:hypothetical protein
VRSHVPVAGAINDEAVLPERVQEASGDVRVDTRHQCVTVPDGTVTAADFHDRWDILLIFRRRRTSRWSSSLSAITSPLPAVKAELTPTALGSIWLLVGS